MSNSFRCWLPASRFSINKAGEGDNAKILVEGYASTELPDRDDETVLQKGLDWSRFIDNGHFNYQHSNDTKNIIGEPTDVTPDIEVDIDGEKTRATMVKGFLYPTKQRVLDLMEHYNAIVKSGGKRGMGFSIEGKVIDRDVDGKTIRRAVVHNVAIAPKPIGRGTTAHILAKAITDGADMPDVEQDIREDLVAVREELAQIKKSLKIGHERPRAEGGGVMVGEKVNKKPASTVDDDGDDDDDDITGVDYAAALKRACKLYPDKSEEQCKRIVARAFKRKALHSNNK